MVREETVALLTSKRKEEGRFPKRKLGTKVSNLFHLFDSNAYRAHLENKLVKVTKVKSGIWCEV